MQPLSDDEPLEPTTALPRSEFGCFTAATFGLNTLCWSMLAWAWTLSTRPLGWVIGMAFGCLEIAGVYMLYKWVSHYRRRALPDISVSVKPNPLQVGAPATLTWRMTGPTHRIECLSIRIEGRVEVRYEDDGTFTHKHRIARVLLLLTEEDSTIRGGRLDFQVPSNLWPSYQAKQGTIGWTLSFKGLAPRHIDLEEEFALCVEQRHASFDPPPALAALLSGDIVNAKRVVIESKPSDWSPKITADSIETSV